MSIFPTKVLLATDGSREAELAAKSAVGLAQQTGSELHVVHVLPWPLNADLVPSSFAFEVRSRLERGAQIKLEELVGRIEALRGEVRGSHLALGRGVEAARTGHEAGLDTLRIERLRGV